MKIYFKSRAVRFLWTEVINPLILREAEHRNRLFNQNIGLRSLFRLIVGLTSESLLTEVCEFVDHDAGRAFVVTLFASEGPNVGRKPVFPK